MRVDTHLDDAVKLGDLSVRVRVPDIQLYVEKDAHTVAVMLEGRIATHLAQGVLEAMARTVEAPPDTFMEYMKFLSQDPELNDRYIAWRAAKRIKGE